MLARRNRSREIFHRKGKEPPATPRQIVARSGESLIRADERAHVDRASASRAITRHFQVYAVHVRDTSEAV